jgi:predicted transcriptional regulator of viral defense system
MSRTERDVEAFLRDAGSARSRDLAIETGATRSQLSRMLAIGRLTRPARGVYALPDEDTHELRDLITVATRAPSAVFCLLTALQFHGLTTQAPFQVWIAIGNNDRAPALDHPPLRIVRMSPASLNAGIETRRIQGISLRLTGIAKTVTDCFKFRNKIGLDVALEALREARRANLASADDLWRYAQIDRVEKVMRPYLEALL